MRLVCGEIRAAHDGWQGTDLLLSLTLSILLVIAEMVGL